MIIFILYYITHEINMALHSPSSITTVPDDWGWFIDLDDQHKHEYKHSNIKIQDIKFGFPSSSNSSSSYNGKNNNSDLCLTDTYLPKPLFITRIISYSLVTLTLFGCACKKYINI